MALMWLTSCAPWGVRQVKVPVPVPCLERPPTLTAVPLASTSRAEAAALGQSGNWAILADRAAASLRILAADRARLKAAVDGCASLPAAEVPGPPAARPPAP
jgi:hypothetical protein